MLRFRHERILVSKIKEVRKLNGNCDNRLFFGTKTPQSKTMKVTRISNSRAVVELTTKNLKDALEKTFASFKQHNYDKLN